VLESRLPLFNDKLCTRSCRQCVFECNIYVNVTKGQLILHRKLGCLFNLWKCHCL